jgi:arginine exporter protein ArgO
VDGARREQVLAVMVAERCDVVLSAVAMAGDALLITSAAVVDLGVWGGDDRLKIGGVLPALTVPAASAAVGTPRC